MTTHVLLFSPFLGTFALSVWVGSSAVQGVTHALHSPLMAMTNAISGMTVLGGMLQLDGGIMPSNGAQVLGTLDPLGCEEVSV